MVDITALKQQLKEVDKLYEVLAKGYFNDKQKEKMGMRISQFPKIKNVIFNPPATIVFWKDGTKTVVKATNEEFDAEKGLAMAVTKKVFGNNYEYFKHVKKWTDKYEGKK